MDKSIVCQGQQKAIHDNEFISFLSVYYLQFLENDAEFAEIIARGLDVVVVRKKKKKMMMMMMMTVPLNVVINDESAVILSVMLGQMKSQQYC